MSDHGTPREMPIIGLMFELNRERGSTLVLVTHDPAMAARCGRTITIAAGKLV